MSLPDVAATQGGSLLSLRDQEQGVPGNHACRPRLCTFPSGSLDHHRPARQRRPGRHPFLCTLTVPGRAGRAVHRTHAELLGLIFLLDGPPRGGLIATGLVLLVAGSYCQLGGVRLERRDHEGRAHRQAGCSRGPLHATRQAAALPALHAGHPGVQPGDRQGDFRQADHLALHARGLPHHRHGDRHAGGQHVDIPLAGLVDEFLARHPRCGVQPVSGLLRRAAPTVRCVL
mmetsp:Transcript_57264/g.170376  ORF Transcript_57264/g.170376 Transcript_57264/m.170376 type:complete len:230 (-) Transcript_57264:1995-2684(-)